MAAADRSAGCNRVVEARGPTLSPVGFHGEGASAACHHSSARCGFVPPARTFGEARVGDSSKRRQARHSSRWEEQPTSIALWLIDLGGVSAFPLAVEADFRTFAGDFADLWQFARPVEPALSGSQQAGPDRQAACCGSACSWRRNDYRILRIISIGRSAEYAFLPFAIYAPARRCGYRRDDDYPASKRLGAEGARRCTRRG